MNYKSRFTTMSKTNENLQAAFAGESQANRKYLAFARRAEAEGKPNLAKLFRVAAEGETIHALSHFNALGGIKDSAANLEAAIAGETYEIETMYPGFISTAVEESNAVARIGMGNALKVEEIHQGLFKAALEKISSGQDLGGADYLVCSVCGFPAEGEAPERCPVCGAPREKFFEIK